MLCEVALPVDLLCINYSAIKRGRLHCNQLPGALETTDRGLNTSQYYCQRYCGTLTKF